jgi:hypothetical protein
MAKKASITAGIIMATTIALTGCSSHTIQDAPASHKSAPSTSGANPSPSTDSTSDSPTSSLDFSNIRSAVSSTYSLIGNEDFETLCDHLTPDGLHKSLTFYDSDKSCAYNWSVGANTVNSTGTKQTTGWTIINSDLDEKTAEAEFAKDGSYKVDIYDTGEDAQDDQATDYAVFENGADVKPGYLFFAYADGEWKIDSGP